MRWLFLIAYAAGAVLLGLWWWGGHPGVGMEIFPKVDVGQFTLRLRAPTGTRIQHTEQLTLQAIEGGQHPCQKGHALILARPIITSDHVPEQSERR